MGGNTRRPGPLSPAWPESFGQGGSDIWVAKLTSGGMITWQKTYGGPQDEVALSILPVSGGGYMVSGYTDSYGMGRTDIWILKLASDGTVLWEKTYGGVSSEWSGVIEPSDDGGYIIAGETRSFGSAGTGQNPSSNAWFMKTNATGDLGCGLGVSSSAVIFTPDAAGQASGSTVADTTSDRSPFIQPGLPSTHTVEVICPIVWK